MILISPLAALTASLILRQASCSENVRCFMRATTGSLSSLMLYPSGMRMQCCGPGQE